MISPFRWWLFVWDRPRTADSPWANSTCYGDLRASSPLRRRNGLSAYWERIHFTRDLRSASGTVELGGIGTCPHTPWPPFFTLSISLASAALSPRRSEERRVGKSVDLGGRRIIKKKKKKEITSRYREINMRAEAGREDSEM